LIAILRAGSEVLPGTTVTISTALKRCLTVIGTTFPVLLPITFAITTTDSRIVLAVHWEEPLRILFPRGIAHVATCVRVPTAGWMVFTAKHLQITQHAPHCYISHAAPHIWEHSTDVLLAIIGAPGVVLSAIAGPISAEPVINAVSEAVIRRFKWLTQPVAALWR
jgi:hypothetical protein